MREKLNSNPILQAALIGLLGVAVAFLLVTRVLNRGGDPPPADAPVATETAAPAPAATDPTAAAPAAPSAPATPSWPAAPPAPAGGAAPAGHGRPGPAQGLGDVVGAQNSGGKHALALGQLGGCGSGSVGRGAPLGVEAHALDAALGERHRDANQVTARGAPGGPVEAAVERLATTGEVAQILGKRLTIHARSGYRPSPGGQRAYG